MFGQKSHADRKSPKSLCKPSCMSKNQLPNCLSSNCLQVCQYEFLPDLNRIKVMGKITKTYICRKQVSTSCISTKFELRFQCMLMYDAL